MKEKCLNLIELSVKEHKKFPLYESIVDEIINYVSENAEIVVNNIKDEEVLNSYIKKLVSTAMVVVPKRLNLSVVKKSEFQVSQNMANSSDEAPVPSSIVENPVDEMGEDVFLGHETANETNIELDDIESNVENIVESDEETVTDAEVFIEEASINDYAENSENILEVDQKLVDNMINGVSQNVAAEYVETETYEIDSFIEEDSTDYDNLEDLELVEDTDIELNSNVTEDKCATEELTEEDNGDFYSEEDSLGEIVEEYDIENQEVDEESFSLGIDADVFADDIENDFVELTEELNEEVEAEILDTVEEQIQEQEIESSNNIGEFEVEQDASSEIYNVYEDVSPNYECFNYEPSGFDFDSQEICEELISLNEKYPEKYILKICEYRYYQKLSIADISESLNIPKDAVVEALNLIVEAIKG